MRENSGGKQKMPSFRFFRKYSFSIQIQPSSTESSRGDFSESCWVHVSSIIFGDSLVPGIE